jgi:hypothetical protein
MPEIMAKSPFALALIRCVLARRRDDSVSSSQRLNGLMGVGAYPREGRERLRIRASIRNPSLEVFRL